MLQLVIPPVEGWDESKEEFVELEKEQKLTLEHSLVSLSKWESKWHKPFLTKEPKTTEETIDYIRCMTTTQNVKPEVYNRLENEHMSVMFAFKCWVCCTFLKKVYKSSIKVTQRLL